MIVKFISTVTKLVKLKYGERSFLYQNCCIKISNILHRVYVVYDRRLINYKV